MTLKDQMTADMATFFNADEFAETIVYAGASIVAIVDIGISNESGNEFSSIGSTARSDRAQVIVKASDVAAPKTGDVVAIRGETWRVAQLVSSDGYTHTLSLTGRSRPWPVQ